MFVTIIQKESGPYVELLILEQNYVHTPRMWLFINPIFVTVANKFYVNMKNKLYLQ